MVKQKLPNLKPIEVKPLIKTEWYEQPNVQAIVLAIVAIVLYAVTFQNEWALDDVISITMNSFTQKDLPEYPTCYRKIVFMVLLEMQATSLVEGGDHLH